MRLHEDVVDTPAPRRPLSPAQALHLANRGSPEPPARPSSDGPDVDVVLPADADGDTSPGT